MAEDAAEELSLEDRECYWACALADEPEIRDICAKEQEEFEIEDS